MYKPDSENIQKANFQEENTWNIPKIKGIKKLMRFFAHKFWIETDICV